MSMHLDPHHSDFPRYIWLRVLAGAHCCSNIVGNLHCRLVPKAWYSTMFDNVAAREILGAFGAYAAWLTLCRVFNGRELERNV